ncbi:MAG: serine/threonine protein kinase [Myxococcaceae bacterium]|nr:serine/threonine protein kinase [Myxococcaceae bacterium]
MDGSQLGKYKVLKLLATGGMGEVFLAETEDAQGVLKKVVVKRILRHLAQDQGFIDMFLDEALLAAELKHPHIVQMRGLEREGDTWFIAMEFVHGKSLRDVLQKASRVPSRVAARLVSQALSGLHYAHTRVDEKGESLGILHRDVTPENVLVGFDGTVKLVDFGIAKATATVGITEPGVLKGKYAYMAPEQFVPNAELDARADVYSMGVVLHELLLHGLPAFAPQTAEAAMAPRPPFVDRPELPLSLNRILRQALEPSLALRFRTAEDMALALEAFVQESGETLTQGEVALFMRLTFGDETASGDPAREDEVLGDGDNPFSTMELPAHPHSDYSSSSPAELARAPTLIEPSLQRQRRQDLSDEMLVPNEVPVSRRWPLLTAAALTGMLLTLGVWRWWSAPAEVKGELAVVPDAGTAPALVAKVPVRPQAVPAPVRPKADDDSDSDDDRPNRRRPKTGRVVFKLPPKVEVTHNGKRVGVTPLPALDLPPGSATFNLKQRATGVTRKVTVKVTAGGEVALKAEFPRR